MKIKLLIYIVTILLGILIFSCSNESSIRDEKITLIVEAVFSSEILIDREDLEITIKSLKSGNEIKENFDKNNQFFTKLRRGAYNIYIEAKGEDYILFGKSENLFVSEDRTLEIKIEKLQIQKNRGFIFKELFFNGELTNSGTFNREDQYWVICNNSDKMLYADGLCFAVTMHYNNYDETQITKHMPQFVPVQCIYRIPGSGSSYPVVPGGEIVLAKTAINHSQNDPNATDLSGADFEFWEPIKGETAPRDVNNPDVPDLVEDFTLRRGLQVDPRGYTPTILFKPIGEDIQTFMRKNKFEYNDIQDGSKRFSYRIPVENILDGVESSTKDKLVLKALPNVVDRGSVGVRTGFTGAVIRRKEIDYKEGKILLDSNDSTNDFEIVDTRRSFPKKNK